MTEDYFECSCYRECSSAGDRICGSDGNFYDNQCRMAMKSCEIAVDITPQDDQECSAVGKSLTVCLSGMQRTNHTN